MLKIKRLPKYVELHDSSLLKIDLIPTAKKVSHMPFRLQQKTKESRTAQLRIVYIVKSPAKIERVGEKSANVFAQSSSEQDD